MLSDLQFHFIKQMLGFQEVRWFVQDHIIVILDPTWNPIFFLESELLWLSELGLSAEGCCPECTNDYQFVLPSHVRGIHKNKLDMGYVTKSDIFRAFKLVR